MNIKKFWKTMTGLAALCAAAATSVQAEVVIDFGSNSPDLPGVGSFTPAAFSALMDATTEASAYTTGTFSALPSGNPGSGVSFDVVVNASANLQAQPGGLGVAGGQATSAIDNKLGVGPLEWVSFQLANVSGLGTGDQLVITSVLLDFLDLAGESYRLDIGTSGSAPSAGSEVVVPVAVNGSNDLFAINNAQFTMGAGSAGDTRFVIQSITVDVITLGGTPARPNILMLCIDDMNDWVGFLGGHPQTKTPNMDSLAAMGAVFSNAHCPAPGCSPSRSAIMFGAEPTTTGLYPFYRLVDLDAQDQATLNAFLPMPKFFRDNGYYTAGYTKVWHNPDNAYKQAEQWDVYQSFGNSSLQLVDGPKYYGEAGLRYLSRPASNPATHFQDRKSADAAVGILQQSHTKPFFLAVGFILPHDPFVTPVDNYNRFDFPIEPPPILAGDLSDIPLVGRANAQLYVDIPLKQDNAWEKVRRGYLASISFTDDNVGLVLDALAASPYADNTIVVLWSDHGHHLGEKQSYSKFSLWEEATRTPFIIYDPRGKAANGQTISEPVSLINMYRTLADLAGLNPPAYVDGISLVPWLDDPSLPKSTPAMTTWGRGNYTLRSGDWRYTRYYNGSEELYHNAVDPNEWTNLAGDPQYNAMKTQLAAYLPTSEAPQIKSGIGLYNVSDADSPNQTVNSYQNQAANYESLGLQPPLNGYSFSEWIEMTGYVGNDAAPGADPNKNGIPNIIEYAIKVPEGDDARDYLPGLVFEADAETNHLAITFRRRLDAPDLRYEVEGSNDLSGAWNLLWNSDSLNNINHVSTTYNADGTQTITVRYPDGIDDEPKAFLRSRVSAP